MPIIDRYVTVDQQICYSDGVKLSFIPLNQLYRFCCLKESLKTATVTVAWAEIGKFCTPVKFGRRVSYLLHATTNAPLLYYS